MCSETGFNSDKKSLFYIRLISVNQKIGFKYGITNKLDGNREKQQKRSMNMISLKQSTDLKYMKKDIIFDLLKVF